MSVTSSRYYTKNRTHKDGFTLVELSIVLIILGLLTGGVLAGQSLIKAAELRSISSEQKEYFTALMAFKGKYFAYPGDITNATAFWGTAGGDGANAACYDVYSTDGSTCNGDGNGQVVGTYGVGNEALRAWQHLSNAEMLSGTYAGGDATDGGFSVFIVADENVPASKYGSGVFWYMGYQGGVVSSAGSFAMSAHNFMRVTGSSVFLTPEDAWNLDKKTDDGKPNTGIMKTNKGDATYPCTDKVGVVGAGENDAEYNLAAGDTSACLPWWSF